MEKSISRDVMQLKKKYIWPPTQGAARRGPLPTLIYMRTGVFSMLILRQIWDCLLCCYRSQPDYLRYCILASKLSTQHLESYQTIRIILSILELILTSQLKHTSFIKGSNFYCKISIVRADCNARIFINSVSSNGWYNLQTWCRKPHSS